jgi:predicted acetyltransferase
MTANEILVPLRDKPAFVALIAEYMAEMERIMGVASPASYPGLDSYWTETDALWPFWLRVDDANAGFALLRRDERSMQMAEFFVARRYRRSGVGLGAARRLIARFPGSWRITQRESNPAAIAFWHRVLDGFVAYNEMTTATDALRREQRFTVA